MEVDGPFYRFAATNTSFPEKEPGVVIGLEDGWIEQQLRTSRRSKKAKYTFHL
jgi:hypothetical protein